MAPGATPLRWRREDASSAIVPGLGVVLNGVLMAEASNNGDAALLARVVGGALTTTSLGQGYPSFLNDRLDTNGAPSPQLIGYGGASTSPMLWDKTTYAGTPATNAATADYVPKVLDALLPQQPNNAWSMSNLNGINLSGSIIGTATYSGTNSTIPQGQHGVMLIPITITQRNYPTASTADSSTDSGSATTSKVIVGSGATDGIALITGDPAMPQLTAQLGGFGSSSGMTVDWRAAITSERSERGTKDDFDIPYGPGESGGGGPGIVNNQPIGQPWTMNNDFPETPQEFFGGVITVYFTIKNAAGTAITPEQNITFKIRGLNPLDATAKTYMQNPGHCEYPWAWAVAEHESRQTSGSIDYVYNEFNAKGSSAELPNFSGTSVAEPQDGWGIFQRDDTDGGIYVDTDQVYSWTVNTNVAMNELESKQTVQQRFFNAVAAAYPNDPEAQTPPSSYPAYSGSTTMLSALDMGTITLYNGAEGCPTTTLNGITYQNPWTFNENGQSGHKWSYTQNANNYLYQVIHDEYEGPPHAIPYSE